MASAVSAKPKTQGERRFRLKRSNQDKVYDPNNPFTHWLKGTDACNRDDEIEKQRRRKQAKSAGSDGRRVPFYERLSKPIGKYTREGFYRKLNHELNEVMYEGSKEEVIRNNLIFYEQQIEEKKPEIDFNEMIFKAKRIPVKQYVEYKREIRLSKLKQVDIAANITDMKNLIVKADEELEENVGTEKKSMEEVNLAVKGSRDELETAKNEKLQSNKKLAEVNRIWNDTKNKILHYDNAIRELNQKIVHMEQNREFLIRMSGYENERRSKYDLYDSRFI